MGESIALGAGTYHVTSPEIRPLFLGRNADIVDARAIGGLGVRILDTDALKDGANFPVNGLTIPLASDIVRVVVYRYNTNARAPIGIYTQGCTFTINPSGVATTPIVSTGTNTDWGYPIVIDIVQSGACILKLTRDSASSLAGPAIEQIVLMYDKTILDDGATYYNEYDTGIYLGATNWVAETNFAVTRPIPSHRMLLGNQSAGFEFNTEQNSVIIWHRAYAGSPNPINTCVLANMEDLNCATYNTQSTTLTNPIVRYPIAILGMGEGTNNVSVSVNETGGLYFDGIQFFPILGPQQPE